MQCLGKRRDEVRVVPQYPFALDLGDVIDGYRVSELVSSPNVTHATLVRR
ncbi:hypothetical protein [Streptomyces niveus]